MEMRLTWSDLRATDEGKLGFLLKAVDDLLPSPSNLRIWGKMEEAACQLCKHLSCTLTHHILSACPKAPADGRYMWRHDQVLQEIAKCVDLARLSFNHQSTAKTRTRVTTEFIPEGQAVQRSQKSNPSANLSFPKH